jgi:hypothetical protein
MPTSNIGGQPSPQDVAAEAGFFKPSTTPAGLINPASAAFFSAYRWLA